jgi:RNA recognition motif-containing protein
VSAYELTLFVGNISFSATREELETLVREAGYRVADTTIARREDGVTSKGFGFV